MQKRGRSGESKRKKVENWKGEKKRGTKIKRRMEKSELGKILRKNKGGSREGHAERR